MRLLNWKEYKLPDICNPKQWKTIPQKDLKSDGYTVYGANGEIGYYSEYNHKYPTILITCRGATCGTINISEPYSYITGNAMALDNLDETLVDIRFLFYQLKFQGFTRVVSGSAQPQITRQNLSNYKVNLPPLEQQRFIADVLDRADALRAARRASLEKLDELLENIFLDMFGDPVTNPRGWEVAHLSDIVTLDASIIDPKQSQYRNLPHIGADKIQKGTGQLLQANTALEDKVVSDKFLFDAEYVLYSKIRPYLQKVALPTYRGICSTDVYPIKPIASKSIREFIYYLLLSKGFTQYAIKNASGANIPRISKKHILSFQSIIPPIKLQMDFQLSYKSVAKQKQIYHNSFDRINQLFFSLQQRAFRGELTEPTNH